MLEQVWEWIVALHLIVGGAFVLVGSIGLLRLKNTMSRMHAPSKATTVGVGAILVASMVYFMTVPNETEQVFAAQDLLIVFFLFLTAPVSAHFMAKAYLHKHPEEAPNLPPTQQVVGWATYEPAPKKADA